MFLHFSKQSKENFLNFHTNPVFGALYGMNSESYIRSEVNFCILLLSSNGCNFFVRNPLRSRSTALERAAPETFENEVSFCLTPLELRDRAR